MVDTTATEVTVVGAVAVPPPVAFDGEVEIDGDDGGCDCGDSDELAAEDAGGEDGVPADDEGSPDGVADATDDVADSDVAGVCGGPTAVLIPDDRAGPEVAVAPVAELDVDVRAPVDVAVHEISTRTGATSRTAASPRRGRRCSEWGLRRGVGRTVIGPVSPSVSGGRGGGSRLIAVGHRTAEQDQPAAALVTEDELPADVDAAGAGDFEADSLLPAEPEESPADPPDAASPLAVDFAAAEAFDDDRESVR
jgi:hypothetical protein